MCSHFSHNPTPTQPYFTCNTSYASTLERIIAWDGFWPSVQCGRYIIVALLPFFTFSNSPLDWQTLLKGCKKVRMFSARRRSSQKQYFRQNSQRFSLCSLGRGPHKSFINCSMDCSVLPKTQNAHTDGDSKMSSQLGHGLFAASATCSELPFSHVAFPNRIAGEMQQIFREPKTWRFWFWLRSNRKLFHVCLEIFEYGFHELCFLVQGDAKPYLGRRTSFHPPSLLCFTKILGNVLPCLSVGRFLQKAPISLFSKGLRTNQCSC
jgi:hypothetical protein